MHKKSLTKPSYISPEHKPKRHQYECCEVEGKLNTWYHMTNISCKRFLNLYYISIFQCPKCKRTFLKGKDSDTQSIEHWLSLNQFYDTQSISSSS